MSTVVRPSGPLPPRVYWTRRLLLLAVLVVILWGLVRCTSEVDPQTQADGTGPSPSAGTSEVTSTPDAAPHRPRGSAPAAGVSLVPAHFSAAGQRCDPSTVYVLPQVSGRVRVGEVVPLQLRVTTSAARACTLVLNSTSLLVAVTSEDQQVWSSTRCSSAVPTRSLVVQPHWATLVDLAWSGRLGRASCDSTERQAAPGPYTVQAALVEGEPAAADFELLPSPPDHRKGQDRPRDGNQKDQT